MQPRQMRETSRPVFPSRVYSIARSPFQSHLRKDPSAASRHQQRLDCAALVHGAVALSHLVEWQGQIKDPARVELPGANEVNQLGQEAAHRGWTTEEMNFRREEL